MDAEQGESFHAFDGRSFIEEQLSRDDSSLSAFYLHSE